MRAVPEKMGCAIKMPNTVGIRAHQTGTGEVRGHGIVGENDLPEMSVTPLKRPVPFHGNDAVRYDEVHRRRCADINDAPVDALPMQHVLGLAILRAGHHAEHVFHAQRNASPVSTKGPGGSLTPHQRFLGQFTHLQWKQYSALSHAGYEGFAGLLDAAPLGAYFMTDFLPHELRAKVEERYELHVSSHLGRAALLLLCIVTELQAYCKFDGAEINARICRVWDALLPLYDTKELYDGRYSQLMADKGIRR
jgi:hypothetical protein